MDRVLANVAQIVESDIVVVQTTVSGVLNLDDPRCVDYLREYISIFNRFKGGLRSLSNFLKEYSRASSENITKEIKTDKVSIDITFNSSKAILGLPKNLEEYADDPLIFPLMVHFQRESLYEIQEIPSTTYTKIIDDSFKVFISGYLAELETDEKIATISLMKDKPFQNGRACARYELLKASLPSELQGYIRGVPKELTGEGKKTHGRLESMVRSKYSRDVAPEVLGLLVKLAKASVKLKQYKVEKKFNYENFLANFEQLTLKHKRKSEIVDKGKKGKQKNSRFVLHSATKPSALSTVFEYEKPIFSDIFENAWAKYKELKEQFDRDIKTQPTKMNFKEYESIIQSLENEQWNIKTKVLKATRGRQVAVRSNGKLDLDKTIAETRKSYKGIDNLAEYARYINSDNPDMSWLDMYILYNGVNIRVRDIDHKEIKLVNQIIGNRQEKKFKIKREISQLETYKNQLLSALKLYDNDRLDDSEELDNSDLERLKTLLPEELYSNVKNGIESLTDQFTIRDLLEILRAELCEAEQQIILNNQI